MSREGEMSNEVLVRRDYYDIQGRWDTPILHMGGLAATVKVLEMVQVDGNMILFDVGCGTGFTACSITKKYGCRVV